MFFSNSAFLMYFWLKDGQGTVCMHPEESYAYPHSRWMVWMVEVFSPAFSFFIFFLALIKVYVQQFISESRTSEGLILFPKSYGV